MAPLTDVARDKLAGKRVFLTGGTGFIGTRLARALLEIDGLHLYVAARTRARAAKLEELGATVLVGDLQDPVFFGQEASRLDFVFHLAGLTRSWTRDEFHAINGEAVGRLAAAAFAANPGLSRFVLVSSQAAAGPSGDHPTLETDEPRPVSNYGASKLAGERALVAALGPDAPFAIARPPAVYGPGDRDLLAMFTAVERGFVPLPGGAEKKFSLVFGDDLVGALCELAIAPAARGGTYFTAAPEPVTTGEFLDAAERALGTTARRITLPSFVADAAGAAAALLRPFKSRPPLINPDRARELRPSSWVCDASRLERDTGYVCATSLDEGARATVAWARAAGYLRAAPPVATRSG